LKNTLIIVAIALSAVVVEAQPCPSVVWTSGVPAQGDTSSSVAVVDYDEDGIRDLVGVIGQSSHQFVWWKGAGNLTFGTATVIATDSSMSNVLVADFTGDGRDDVAVRFGNPSNLVILPGTGSGRGPTITKSFVSQSELLALNYDADAAAELISRNTGSVQVFDNVSTTLNQISSISAPTGFFVGSTSADFDGDGKHDIAAGTRSPAGMFVYFGSGGGAFSAPVVLPADAPNRMAAGDLDNDGKPDFVVANWRETGIYDQRAGISIYRNQGARTFTHTILSVMKPGNVFGDPTYVVLSDVSGDGVLDIITGILNGSWITTLVGVGDGTFRTPTFHQYFPAAQPDYAVFPEWSATADLNGDGRQDLVTAAYGIGPLPASGSCATQVHLHSATPIITLGHNAKLKALVSGFAADTPAPYGTVTFREGATVLGASPVGADGKASLTVSGLGLGDHSLTAEFSGNAQIAAATSAAATQKVVTTTTQTILTLPAEPAVYGQPYAAEIDVLNGLGEYSFVTVNLDGVETTHYTYNPFPIALEPGSHTISAEFGGEFNKPASEAAPQMFTIAKGTPLMAKTGALAVRSGTAHSFTFNVSGSGAIGPGGSVQLIEGTTVLGSGALVNGSVTLNATLARGAHDVRAVYSGDSRYLDVTQNFTLEVLPNQPFVIEARGLTSGVHIAYLLPANTNLSTLQLFRRPAGNPTWQLVPGWNSATGMDASVPSVGDVYEYQLNASLNDGTPMTSPADSALLFHDDLLNTGIVVKRNHFSELRSAVNLLRTQAGLAAFEFDATYNESAIVRASHLGGLRTALTQARQTLGMSVPAFTGGGIGASILASRVQELRELAR
jgi:hypothetical protein